MGSRNEGMDMGGMISKKYMSETDSRDSLAICEEEQVTQKRLLKIQDAEGEFKGFEVNE